MQRTDIPKIDAATFHTDVQYLEALWQRVPIGEADMPLIDTGSDKGEPLVFVPILEHLEFVYARQVRAFGQRRRVIMYRRHETRTQPVGLVERAEELRKVLDALGLESVDLVGHGDAAMVLFEFAARYPQRCRSLIIVAQGADYRIAPHPFIWLLHELFVRLPVEYILPALYSEPFADSITWKCSTSQLDRGAVSQNCLLALCLQVFGAACHSLF